MRRMSTLLVVSLCLAQTPGCLLVAGAAIAVGVVHVTSDDTAEVLLDGSTDTIFEHVEKEMASRGTVTFSNRVGRRLEGEIGNADLVVTLERATDKTSRVRATARKNAGVSPDKDVAQEFLVGVTKRVSG